jgi:hypothetical protein
MHAFSITMLEYPLRLGPSRLFPLYLENRLHDAAIYSQRRPVRRRRKLASQVGRDRCDSSTVANRFSRDDGRTFLKNSFSISVFDLISCLAITSTKPATPSNSAGPARIRFAVTPVPATDSAIPRATADPQTKHHARDSTGKKVLAGLEAGATPACEAAPTS